MIGAAAIYLADLNRAPIYLSNDETEFALQAHAIATTARDEGGRFLPLYFHVVDDVWFHPALVYAMAPVLAVAAPMPWAIRLPTAMVAVVSVLLVFVLARRLGASDAAAIGAAAILTLTPAHVMLGRVACDYLFPVPCVLAWLILLTGYGLSGKHSRLFAAGAVLGLGLYTYIASIVMMPMYLVLTYVALFLSGARRIRPYAAVTIGFVVLALPLAAWLASVPEVYAGFAHRYRGTGTDVLHEPAALLQFELIKQRWHVYRSFYEWPFLFDVAETHVMSSTYRTGVFLKALTVLIPIGAYHILRNRRTIFTLVILAVFLTAPMAASLVAETHTIDRALVLLPMGALIGAFGIDWLLVHRTRIVNWAGRAAVAGLFVWMGVQFKDFYTDYLTTYRVRSAFWFHWNHPAAFEPILRLYPPNDQRQVYLSDGLPWIREHWKLYLIRRGRTDLLPRTVYFRFETLDLAHVTPGSVLLTGADDPAERDLLKRTVVMAIGHVREPDGALSFTRFERIRD